MSGEQSTNLRFKYDWMKASPNRSLGFVRKDRKLRCGNQNRRGPKREHGPYRR